MFHCKIPENRPAIHLTCGVLLITDDDENDVDAKDSFSLFLSLNSNSSLSSTYQTVIAFLSL